MVGVMLPTRGDAGDTKPERQLRIEFDQLRDALRSEMARIIAVANNRPARYTSTMKRTTPTSSVADKMLDLAAGCFDAPTLNALAKLRLSPKLAARVDRLAEKANEGELTARERAEYQSYIETSELLGVIQLRARRKLGLPIPAE